MPPAMSGTDGHHVADSSPPRDRYHSGGGRIWGSSCRDGAASTYNAREGTTTMTHTIPAAVMAAMLAVAQTPQAPAPPRTSGDAVGPYTRQLSDPAAASRGRAVYAVECVDCHGPTARGTTSALTEKSRRPTSHSIEPTSSTCGNAPGFA